jgi:hypothetical protein
MEATDDITPPLVLRPSMALIDEASSPPGVVMLGGGDDIDEVAISSETLPRSGGPQAEHDEVQTLSESGEAGLDALLGGVQVSDSLRGGAVPSDVGGESPVFEASAPFEEDTVVGEGGVAQVSEPLWQWLRGGTLILLARRGVLCGIQLEGVDLAPGFPHSTLCRRGVPWRRPDVSGWGSMSVVGDIEVRESSAIGEEALGAGADAVSDGGGGSAGAEPVIFGLQSCDTGFVCCGARSERAGGDLSHSAKVFDVSAGSERLEDGEG